MKLKLITLGVAIGICAACAAQIVVNKQIKFKKGAALEYAEKHLEYFRPWQVDEIKKNENELIAKYSEASKTIWGVTGMDTTVWPLNNIDMQSAQEKSRFVEFGLRQDGVVVWRRINLEAE